LAKKVSPGLALTDFLVPAAVVVGGLLVVSYVLPAITGGKSA
jgi:hypothetical protein